MSEKKMRILVISDSHGRNDDVAGVIEQVGHIDMLIHCGDVERGDDYIRSLVDCPVHMVRGNNDFFSDLPGEEEFMVEGYHIFTTHGHGYYVSMGETRLKQEARGRGADIVMYGHTHRPFYEKEEGLITLNPGSLCYPRQPGRKPSYMIMQIDSNGKLEITQKYLN
mgnify:CR=1 FL=1